MLRVLWKQFVTWIDWHGRITTLVMIAVSIIGGTLASRAAAIWGAVRGPYLWLIGILVFCVFLCTLELAARGLERKKTAGTGQDGDLLTSTSSRVDVELTPHAEQSEEVVLTVTNRGNEGRFHAKARITAVQLGAKRLAGVYKTQPFDLKWKHTPERGVAIGKGDSENLLIAAVQDVRGHDRAFMTIWELSEGAAHKFEVADWNKERTEELPKYELEVAIFAEGAYEPYRERFTLGPRTFFGPLEMVREGASLPTTAAGPTTLAQRLAVLSHELLAFLRDQGHPPNARPGDDLRAVVALNRERIHRVHDGYMLRFHAHVERVIYELGEKGVWDYELNDLVNRQAHSENDIRAIAEKLLALRTKLEVREITQQ